MHEIAGAVLSYSLSDPERLSQALSAFNENPKRIQQAIEKLKTL